LEDDREATVQCKTLDEAKQHIEKLWEIAERERERKSMFMGATRHEV
jgi:hypothetical protein